MHHQVEVFVDPIRTIDVGVWGIQIKIDNTAIIHSVRAMGYPALWDPHGDRENHKGEIKNYDSGYVFAPRPLFPKYFLSAVNSPLNTQLKAEENFVLVPGIQPVLDFYQDWKENKKTAYNEMIKAAFEGHLRTNYKAVSKAYGLNEQQGNLGSMFERVQQIWENAAILFEGRNIEPDLAQWPDWIVDRATVHLPMLIEGVDSFFDFFRSLFANVYSRKLPQYGNVNEQIMYKDLKSPTIANILAMNAFAHHDIITLPMGLNQTITTETLDAVDDATSRIPVIGGALNWAIEGFHNLVFGKSPSGFKKGGIDKRLKYYGDNMVGIMSAEMYLFYTATRNKNNDAEAKGLIAFNAFQEQGDDIPERPQPPASTFPYGVPDVKHTTYFDDVGFEEDFKGVKAVSDSEMRHEYNHLNSYIIRRDGIS